MTYLGWTQTRQGQAQIGIQNMEEGVALWHSTGAQLIRPYLMFLLADGHARTGEGTQALKVTNDALALIDQTGGDLVAAGPPAAQRRNTAHTVRFSTLPPNRNFQQAIALAARQSRPVSGTTRRHQPRAPAAFTETSSSSIQHTGTDILMVSGRQDNARLPGGSVPPGRPHGGQKRYQALQSDRIHKKLQWSDFPDAQYLIPDPRSLFGKGARAMSDTIDKTDLNKRKRLVALLTEAAEFEHNLVCQYLFTGFSLKRHVEEGVSWQQLEMMRGWQGNIMLIARQEMEHLGLVINLLTAIGEAPNLRRPNFPLPPQYYPIDVASRLEKFDLSSLLRFLFIEMPQELTEEDRQYLEQQVLPLLTEDNTTFHKTGILQTLSLPVSQELDADQPHITTGAFYREIRRLLEEIDPALLFIGPPSAQFVTTEIVPIPIRGISLAPGTPLYSISLSAVTDRKTACAAVDQIIEEGEGTPGDYTNSHFGRLLSIYKSMKAEYEINPSFAPARPVVSNPRTLSSDEVPVEGKVTFITNPYTNQVSELFDQCYETTLLLLTRYFAHADESDVELAALQQAVFFPMMTSVIRPLGEVLTLLPAFADDSPDHTAGPTFEILRSMSLLPHRKSAWQVLNIQLQLMMDTTQNLCAEGKQRSLSPALLARLQLVYENIGRIQIDFVKSMAIGRTL